MCSGYTEHLGHRCGWGDHLNDPLWRFFPTIFRPLLDSFNSPKEESCWVQGRDDEDSPPVVSHPCVLSLKGSPQRDQLLKDFQSSWLGIQFPKAISWTYNLSPEIQTFKTIIPGTIAMWVTPFNLEMPCRLPLLLLTIISVTITLSSS